MAANKNNRSVSLYTFAWIASALLIILGAANALYRSADRQPVDYVSDDTMNDHSDEMISETNEEHEDSSDFISRKCDRNFFDCRLMKEILKTHRFLQRNENGLQADVFYYIVY